MFFTVEATRLYRYYRYDETFALYLQILLFDEDGDNYGRIRGTELMSKIISYHFTNLNPLSRRISLYSFENTDHVTIYMTGDSWSDVEKLGDTVLSCIINDLTRLSAKYQLAESTKPQNTVQKYVID